MRKGKELERDKTDKPATYRDRKINSEEQREEGNEGKEEEGERRKERKKERKGKESKRGAGVGKESL